MPWANLLRWWHVCTHLCRTRRHGSNRQYMKCIVMLGTLSILQLSVDIGWYWQMLRHIAGVLRNICRIDSFRGCCNCWNKAKIELIFVAMIVLEDVAKNEDIAHVAKFAHVSSLQCWINITRYRQQLQYITICFIYRQFDPCLQLYLSCPAMRSNISSSDIYVLVVRIWSRPSSCLKLASLSQALKKISWGIYWMIHTRALNICLASCDCLEGYAKISLHALAA